MFPKKLTPEAKDFICVQLGCNRKAKDIQNDLKLKYNIDISLARIGQVQMSKSGSDIYDVARAAYLKNLNKDVAKFVQHKEKRQLILERLLEEILSTDPAEFGNKFSTGLKERCELALKILKQAESEDKERPAGGVIPKGSLVQWVDKQQIVMGGNTTGEVIEQKTIDNGTIPQNI